MACIYFMKRLHQLVMCQRVVYITGTGWVKPIDGFGMNDLKAYHQLLVGFDCNVYIGTV